MNPEFDFVKNELIKRIQDDEVKEQQNNATISQLDQRIDKGDGQLRLLR